MTVSSFTTPGAWNFEIPAGVTSIAVDVTGSQGGTGTGSDSTGGLGGRIQFTLAVSPGDILSGIIAALGAGAVPGRGGGARGAAGAGPGGGYTDLQLNGSVRSIAAGGGGFGVRTFQGTHGGAGGGTTGGDGSGAGSGGTQIAGGTGQGGATDGSSLQGGSGGDGTPFGQNSGGGGGGGFFGGGGGGRSAGSSQGGGGGSSWTHANCTGVAHTQGYKTGDGYVTLTYFYAPIITEPTIPAGIHDQASWTSQITITDPDVGETKQGFFKLQKNIASVWTDQTSFVGGSSSTDAPTFVSSYEFTGLTDGEYRIQAYAQDGLGKISDTETSASFTVQLFAVKVASDDLTVGVTDIKSVLAGTLLSFDGLTLQTDDAYLDIASSLITTDPLSVSLTEARTIAATLARVDTVSVGVTEVKSLDLHHFAADTLSVGVTEGASDVQPTIYMNSVDTLGVGTTEAFISPLSVTLNRTDPLSVGVTDVTVSPISASLRDRDKLAFGFGAPVSIASSGGLDIPSTTTALGIMSGSRYTETVLRDRPLGYWKLDETSGSVFADSSGNGYNAVRSLVSVSVDGSMPFSTSKGTRGANSGAVVMPETVDAFTVEFWIRQNPEAAVGAYESYVSRRVTNGFSVSRNNLTDKIYMRVDTSAGINQYVPISLDPVLDGNWHHVVVTVDNGITAAYLDGGAPLASIYNHGDGFITGTNFTPVASDESRDEVAYYDYALTAEQVRRHYEAAQSSVDDDIEFVVHFKLDDYSPVGSGCIADVWAGGYPLSFAWQLSSAGGLSLYVSHDGVAFGAALNGNPPFTDGTAYWLKTTRRVSDGLVQSFWAPSSQEEPEEWTSFGADGFVAPGLVMFPSRGPLLVGGLLTSQHTVGEYYQFIMRKGINLEEVVKIDFTDQTPGSVAFKDELGNPWTVQTPASIIAGMKTLGQESALPTAQFGAEDELQVQILEPGTAPTAGVLSNDNLSIQVSSTKKMYRQIMSGPASDDAIDAIMGAVSQIIRRVEIYESDGETPYAANFLPAFIDGMVTVDQARAERRMLDLTLADDETGTLKSHPDGFWYDKVIKVFRGVYNEEVYWENQIGEFMIDRISQGHFPNTVKVTGRDYAKKMLVSKLPQATMFPANEPIEEIVRTLALNAGITKFNLPLTGIDSEAETVFDKDTDRWKIANDLCIAHGYELFLSPDGYLTMQEFTDPILSPILWEFQTGSVIGNLVSFEKSTNDSLIRNHIVVTGEALDKTPVWGEAKNEDPTSPTRIARIGERTEHHASGFVTTHAQCDAISAQMLNIKALEQFDVSITGIVVSWLEVGNTVAFYDPNPAVGDPTRYLLSSFGIPLSLAPMTGLVKRVRVITT